jgi:hypothetical protein
MAVLLFGGKFSAGTAIKIFALKPHSMAGYDCGSNGNQRLRNQWCH